MPTSLSLLRDLHKRHETMVNLANELDWDGLDREWHAAERHFATLMSMPPLAELTGSDYVEAQKLIARLLAQQKLITEKVRPWMEQVRPMLDSFDRYPQKPEQV
ncbi:MAG: flagellar protein FliT [Betaproteobacteria bacterium]